MLGKLGLRGKLLLAFALIAGLPTLAGFLGLVELRGLARSQSEVIRQTIPAIADVRGIAEESTRIIAVAPRLAEVDTQSDRRALARDLSQQVAALAGRLERLELERGARIGPLRAAVSQVEEAVSTLDALVEERIAARAVFRERVGRDLQSATTLLDMADTLVANAEMGTTAVISSLYGGTNIGLEGAGTVDALDKLLEVDLFQLSLMFELRSRTAEVGLLINRIDEAATLEELDAIEAAFLTELAVVSRRIAAIRDPGRLQQAEQHLAELQSVTADDVNLFDLQARILTAGNRIRALKQALQDAALRLGGEAAQVADQAQDVAIGSAEIFAREMWRAQTSSGLAALAGLVLALAVLWFFVRGHITRRLDRLHGAMTALATGDLDRLIRPKGVDEIARMEEATEVFRQQAIAKDELEKQRDRDEKELLEHRNNLQRMVSEQTERLRQEVAAHDKARREAEAADRAKSEFLAMMSHEIRTPMNGMLGLLRSLGEDRLAPEQRHHLSAAQASGQNLLQILNDILDYSKIEKGGVRAVNSTFSLQELVSDIMALMRPSAEAKGINLLLDVPDDIVDVVRGDVAKMRQILFNLLSNALKFTDEGEVILRLRAGAQGGATHRVVFEVSDTGRGVSEDARARVFEAFEQEDSETGGRFGGTGLGLAISKRFADAIGASLTLESTSGIGSVFTLAVDLRAGDPRDLVARESNEAIARADTALDILVVEDNEINQMVARGYLERMGHRCRCLSDAEAALALLRDRAFDVVLMDVNLPGLTGTEATRLIRGGDGAFRADIPIIGISAHVQDEQIAALFDAGMNGFVAKPVSPERLAQALDSVLRGNDGDVFLSQRSTGVKAVSRVSSIEAALRQNIADFGLSRTREIATLFMDRVAEEQRGMEQALAAEDWQELRKAAHRMKGTVGNFDQRDVVHLLEKLEASAHSGHGEATGRLLQQLSVIVPQLRDATATALRQLDPVSSHAP
ncbi:MAG: response regulator [Roseovarius sp.]|nr:response regulator [Roseovarius sp.]